METESYNFLGGTMLKMSVRFDIEKAWDEKWIENDTELACNEKKNWREHTPFYEKDTK